MTNPKYLEICFKCFRLINKIMCYDLLKDSKYFKCNVTLGLPVCLWFQRTSFVLHETRNQILTLALGLQTVSLMLWFQRVKSKANQTTLSLGHTNFLEQLD